VLIALVACGKGRSAHKRAGTTDVTFTVDTPTAIEWKHEYAPGKFSYHFDIPVQVGGTFHCSTTPKGVRTEADLAAHKTACATLAKAP